MCHNGDASAIATVRAVRRHVPILLEFPSEILVHAGVNERSLRGVLGSEQLPRLVNAVNEIVTGVRDQDVHLRRRPRQSGLDPGPKLRYPVPGAGRHEDRVRGERPQRHQGRFGDQIDLVEGDHLGQGTSANLVEHRPDGGDLARKLGASPALNAMMMGTSFLAQNAGKKSVTIDLKHAEGKALFRDLIATADVVVDAVSTDDIPEEAAPDSVPEPAANSVPVPAAAQAADDAGQPPDVENPQDTPPTGLLQ